MLAPFSGATLVPKMVGKIGEVCVVPCLRPRKIALPGAYSKVQFKGSLDTERTDPTIDGRWPAAG